MDVRGIVKSFDKIRADYDMSRNSRFVRRRTGVNPQGSGADYHYRSESKYYADIEQARDMDRNDALIGTLADRRVDNIVQSGFTLDPKTGDKALDLDLWQRWNYWANDPDSCDIAGEMTWRDLERYACRSETIDGDIIVAGTTDGQFQVLESHLIQCTSPMPMTFCGVEMDQYRKRLRYHVVVEKDAFGRLEQGKPLDVRDSNGVRQLFHVMCPKRVNQTRGITAVASVFSLAGMLEDINFAKLVQQQAVSCFAIIRKQVMSAGDQAPSVVGYGQSSTETTAAGVRYLEGISPGMEIISNPAEEITGFSPNVPNAEYFDQVELIMKIIGVNFGLPLCLVLMDGSETNFSGWRGAVDEARKGFVSDQVNLVRRLHQPFYKWWLTKQLEGDVALRKAAKRLDKAFYAHNWNLPTWSYIEPVADAQGDAEQLKNALTSPRRLHAARGKDWEEVSEEIIEDNKIAISSAMKTASEINAANPTQPPVTWRDLIPLPMPSNVTMGLQDPAVVQETAQEVDTEQPQPAGEMAGLSRQQWNRNRKAIKDILTELAEKTTSEAAARVYLESLGLTSKSIDALIADAADGTVEAPEVNADV